MNIKLNIVLLCLCLFFICPGLKADDQRKTQQAKEAVEKYLQAEFSGIEDIRLDMVKFSRQRALKEKKRDPNFEGFRIWWSADPLYVVNAYQVQDTEIKSNRAEVKVVFERLAVAAGNSFENRQIKPDYKKADIVKYNLRFVDNKWWIYDPPRPRVSLKAIIEYYRKEVDSFPADWLERKDISEGQKQSQRKYMADLKLLEGLVAK